MAVLIRTTETWLSAWADNYSPGPPFEMRGFAEDIKNTRYFVTSGQGRFVLTLFEKLAASVPFNPNRFARATRNNQTAPCGGG